MLVNSFLIMTRREMTSKARQPTIFVINSGQSQEQKDMKLNGNIEVKHESAIRIRELSIHNSFVYFT
jgi:hypothetical protein